MKKWLILTFFLFSSQHRALDFQREYLYYSAEQKQEWLWAQIKASVWEKNPALPISIISTISSFKKLTNNLEFLDFNLINHFYFPHGSVAKIQYIPVNKYYSGIFESGAIGIAKFFLLSSPITFNSFIPGISFKFLIDESPSLTLRVLSSFDGQKDNHNWFASKLSNFEKPGESFYAKILALSFRNLLIASLEKLAESYSNGRLCFETYEPSKLLFIPTNEVKNIIKHDSKNDFRYDLSLIPKGTVIYDVYAKNNCNKIKIGEVKLISKARASKFADNYMFF